MRGQGRALRAMLFVGCLIPTFALIFLLLIRSMGAADLGKPTIDFNIVDILQRRLPRLEKARDRATQETLQVVVLGDSTVISYPRGRQIPDQLERVLEARREDGPRIETLNLAVSGVSVFDYYFLADEIVRVRPDGVLIAFNLDSLSDAWRGAYLRPVLAGMIDPDRMLHTMSLPLHWIGLTFDQLFFYVGIVQFGGYDLWYHLTLEQARMGRARTAVRDYFDALVGANAGRDFDNAAAQALLRKLFAPDTDPDTPYRRFNRTGQLEHYRSALEGIPLEHPLLRALESTIDVFEREGIPVVVYVNPVNHEHMDALGILDREGLASTAENIGVVVRRKRAAFVDLHDLLPDAAFRDGTGHFTVSDEFDGPARLAEALAPTLLSELRSQHEPAD